MAFEFSDNEKLKKQLSFLTEIDKMKTVFRRTVIMDGSKRRENDAEHSWHIAMFALILSEYSRDEVDVSRVIKICLAHDLIEIYAGDTFAYDSKGHEDKAEREAAAADRLFGMLDGEQGREIRALWDEFEAKETPEARFANVCDRFQPLIHNYYTDGHTWQEGGVTAAQVLSRMDIIRTDAPELWPLVTGIIESSVAKGILKA